MWLAKCTEQTFQHTHSAKPATSNSIAATYGATSPCFQGPIWVSRVGGCCNYSCSVKSSGKYDWQILETPPMQEVLSPPWCSWDLHSSRMLCGVLISILSMLRGHCIDPHFQGLNSTRRKRWSFKRSDVCEGGIELEGTHFGFGTSQNLV